MSGFGGLTDAHVAAIVAAHALIESAQGEGIGGLTDQAERDAAEHGWADVRLLVHYARSLATREQGLDDTEHVRAMLDGATAVGDPVLLALALTTSATRRADTATPWNRTVADHDGGTRRPVVGAVVAPMSGCAAVVVAALVAAGFFGGTSWAPGCCWSASRWPVRRRRSGIGGTRPG